MITTVPSERLFWTVVDAPGVRSGAIPAGLWPLIEDDLPLDVSSLWAVGVPIEDGRFAVCAIRRTDIQDDRNVARLVPAEVPPFVPVSQDRFNFLIGPFEPVPVRRAKFRAHLIAAACTLLTACLVALGLARRATAWEATAAAAGQATGSIIDSIAPAAGWTRDNLALELGQRRQSAPSDAVAPPDAAPALAGIIANWPTHIPSKPQAISATGTAASISVTIPGDAHAFLAALKPPEGWTLEEPRLASIDKATRLNLELRRGTP